MAQLLFAKTNPDPTGNLTVIENILPFEIKRVFYIYSASGTRGGHRHKKNVSALICIKGTCKVDIEIGKEKSTFLLDSADKVLVLQPNEYRTMYDFTSDAVLLVLASENYDPDDYINFPSLDIEYESLKDVERGILSRIKRIFQQNIRIWLVYSRK